MTILTPLPTVLTPEFILSVQQPEGLLGIHVLQLFSFHPVIRRRWLSYPNKAATGVAVFGNDSAMDESDVLATDLKEFSRRFR
ncbi:hypothetical protein [Paenibacillus pabuli]|uniref:hypothetical protein n=1 Tax=Paenibacillus pabuli TaxID=1472 RepID=UPI003CF34236